jgi:circadian clock protein KaiC
VNVSNRIESGIPGLDRLLGGGLIQNSVTLVTGETGTGKTIFCSQFLWHGLRKGETGIYMTLEEDPEDIKEDAKLFGWDFSKYEKRGLFRLIYHDPAQVNNIGSVMIDEIKNINAKRLVIDSTSVIGMNIQDITQIRKTLYSIINMIKKSRCTALITAEIPEGSKGLSKFGVEEFVADGVVVLNYLEYASGGLDRSLIIRKMRRTDHGRDIYPIDIGERGMVIKPVG